MLRNTIISLFLVALFAFSLVAPARAQTTLVAGDIAFTGYISSATGIDEFSFVLLRNMTAGTVINFTDNGWLNPGVFRPGEQTATLTLGSARVAGSEIVITGASAGAATSKVWQTGTGFVSAGTVTGLTPSLNTSGDQLLAYQGTAASPTFIAGIHANSYTIGLGECANTNTSGWDPDCFDGAGGTVGNSSFSKLPATLTAGFSALFLGVEGVNNSDPDNAVFNCTGPLNTVAQVRTAVFNQANWTKTNGNPPNLVLPTGCTFFSVPSAAEVEVSGRVLASDGRAVRGAIVQITSPDGTVRSAISSSFGYYRFTGVVVGETYVVAVASKRYVFTPRTLVVTDQISDFDLVAEQ